jgi:hypothetical protein
MASELLHPEQPGSASGDDLAGQSVRKKRFQATKCGSGLTKRLDSDEKRETVGVCAQRP